MEKKVGVGKENNILKIKLSGFHVEKGKSDKEGRGKLIIFAEILRR